jgi:hypothetical protein
MTTHAADNIDPPIADAGDVAPGSTMPRQAPAECR